MKFEIEMDERDLAVVVDLLDMEIEKDMFNLSKERRDSLRRAADRFEQAANAT